MSRFSGLFSTRQRHSKGAAELSVVVVTASLVAGVFFGNGLSRTAVELADGLTWIGDEPTGEVIQVNPATGRPELRVKVGGEGDDLDLAQYDGRLFVTNHTTGDLMSFDLTSILVSGQRRVSKNGSMHTLAHDGSVYLVDEERSTIAAVDPGTLDAIGSIWVAPDGLADAAIDGTGAVWSLTDSGELSELRWSDRSHEFEIDSEQTVDQSGDGSVLVAHDRGVTVFGADAGIVTQVGTGHEMTADAPKLSGELHAPESAPADLVPVSAPDTGTVVLASPDGVREVDVSSVQCGEPATPEVFRGRVYVPCPGDGKVIQLDREGSRAGPDIATKSDSPELVVDDDNLIINNPGASTGNVVHDDGSVTTMVRYDDSLPTTQPTSVDDAAQTDASAVSEVIENDPIEELTEAVQVDPDEGEEPDETEDPGWGPSGGQSTGPAGGGSGGSHGGNGCRRHCWGGGNTPGTNPPHPTNPTTSPSGGVIPPTQAPALVLQAPRAVRAEQLSEGQVQVSWNHSGPAARDFVVTVAGDDDELATVPGANRQAIVEIPPGQSVAFVVTARTSQQEASSAPSNSVSTSGRPGAPGNLSGDAHYETDGTIQTYIVTVRWGAAEPNGSPITRYDATISTPNGVQTVSTDGGGRSAAVSWSCDYNVDPSCPIGGDYSASVVATNDQGPGPEGTVSGAGPAQPAPPLPAAGADIVDSATTNWSGRSEEGVGTTTLKLSPPPDWAAFSGTCEWRHAGNKAGEVTGPVRCNATSVTVTINNGVLRRPDDGKTTHSIVFTATNANGTATSKRYTWQTEQTVLCQTCQLP